MNMENENLKITIILKNNPKLFANANVAINTVDFGFITIKGFQIWKSSIFNERLQEHINITPPNRQFMGHTISLVFIENRTLWFDLEEKIYSAFCQKRQPEIKEEVTEEDWEKIDKAEPS